MTWPDLYILGAPKCGTTALYDALRQVPGIYGPDTKEPWYWTQGLDDELPFLQGQPGRPRKILSEADYRSLYAPGADQAYRMDATPHNLYAPSAAERIRAAVPGAKAIVLLRDPVARAHSDYLMKMRGPQRGQMIAAFGEDDFLAVLRAEQDGRKRHHAFAWKGRYAGHVERIQALFGDDLRVVLSADFSRDPHGVVADLLQWLDLDPGLARGIVVERSNRFQAPRNRLAGKILARPGMHQAARALLPAPVRVWLGQRVLLSDRVPHPVLSEAERRFLVEYYRDDVVRLEGILGRPLPELRRSWHQARDE